MLYEQSGHSLEVRNGLEEECGGEVVVVFHLTTWLAKYASNCWNRWVM